MHAHGHGIIRTNFQPALESFFGSAGAKVPLGLLGRGERDAKDKGTSAQSQDGDHRAAVEGGRRRDGVHSQV